MSHVANGLNKNSSLRNWLHVPRLAFTGSGDLIEQVIPLFDRKYEKAEE